MTVEILRLSGRDGTGATAEANRLLAARDKHPDLSRLLVIDDTAALAGHATAYQRLLTSRRLHRLLCVAVGLPGPEDPGQAWLLRIPPNISGRQGSGVLWVSDPLGIEWRLSASAIAIGRTGDAASGLDYLVEILSVDKVYDKTLRTLVNDLPNGVASPGLRLAGADDEAASFAAALALAIEHLVAPGQPVIGAETPFASLLSPGSGPIGLAEDGALAGFRDRITESANAVTRILANVPWRLFRRSAPYVREYVIAIGNDLRAFRDQVAQLLTQAQAAGDLSEAQRHLVATAGLRLPPPVRTDSHRLDPQADQPSSITVVLRTVADAIRSGDSLPLVIKRLTLTGHELAHKGSAAYLPEVERACPPALLGRLADPAPRPPGKAAVQEWQRGLGLDDSARAAGALAELVVTVARKEWSGRAAVADEASRTRIALDAICKKLAEHAAGSAPGDDVSPTRAARRVRLGDSLTPVLCDLVLAVLRAESAAPSSGGQEAYRRAKEKTADLLADWVRHADQHGAVSPPPFAISPLDDHTYASDEIAEIAEALLLDPKQEMLQLCAPDDLSVLDVAGWPGVIAFAPRLTKDALGDIPLPDVEWTMTGAYAGLLRLVPLRPAALSVEWWDGTEPPDSGEPQQDAS